MKKNPCAALPLAERFWFVDERGMGGWVKSAREPVLWRLWDSTGLWRLSNIKDVDSDDWVLPFCQFKSVYYRYSFDTSGAQAIFVEAVARFPTTPRRWAPRLVVAVAPRLSVVEQTQIPF